MRNLITFIFSNQEFFLFLTFAVALLLIITIAIPSTSGQIAPTTKTISAYEINTRPNITKPQSESYGYDNSPLENITQLYKNCPAEVAIVVHGWYLNESQAKEKFDRVKMSLENNSYYNTSLVGFSWKSDLNWSDSKIMAKYNGPTLADFIFNLANTCKQQHSTDIKIRLVGHSLGSGVILSSLDSLHKNSMWNSNDFKITSVHLMGAAVDDDEVSKDDADVYTDNNSSEIKSAYGKAIEEEVIRFYNLFNMEDDTLEPGNISETKPIHYYDFNSLENQPVYYPYYEQDLALGQNGSQSNISKPLNYVDINVKEQIPLLVDADGNGECDYRKQEKGTNPITWTCTITKVGDNHAGYFGFRVNNTRLEDDGAMNVVVNDWKSETPSINQD